MITATLPSALAARPHESRTRTKPTQICNARIHGMDFNLLQESVSRLEHTPEHQGIYARGYSLGVAEVPTL